MNEHYLQHGDVVRSTKSNTYRMYVYDKDSDANLICVCLSSPVTYDLKYTVGGVLPYTETFVFNIVDLVECANKQ